MHRLSPVSAGRGSSLAAELGLLGARASLVSERGLQYVRCTGLAVLRHAESSCTRDQSLVPWTGREIFNHWTTREFLYFVLFGQRHLCLLTLPWTSCLKSLLLLALNIWIHRKFILPDISFTFSFPPYIFLPSVCFCPPNVWPFTHLLLVDECLLTTCNVQVYARWR